MAINLKKPALKKLLATALPRPERITDMDDSTKPDAVSFRWFGIDFTVTTDLQVAESNMRITTCHSMLMQALLRETNANN